MYNVTAHTYSCLLSLDSIQRQTQTSVEISCDSVYVIMQLVQHVEMNAIVQAFSPKRARVWRVPAHIHPFEA